jgi:uncharacterized protein (TIGR02611 family)
MLIRYALRIVIAIVGMTVLLFGLALTVLPGPAFVVIPIGLAILATEFAWARRWLRFLQESAETGVNKLEEVPYIGRFVRIIREVVSQASARIAKFKSRGVLLH